MDIFLGTLFIIVCVLLVVVVLLQKGRGGGLSAAFGGMGSSAFGTRTGDVFTWVTIVLTALFLLLAIGATLLFRPPTGTVAAPSLDPPGAVLDGVTPVLLRCKTSGAKVAFTTDGTDPLREDAKGGTVTARVQPGVTLKAQAFREKWVDSPIVTVKYVDQSEAPEPEESIETLPAEAPTTQPVAP
jgi:preprotein translocase subunit SecG